VVDQFLFPLEGLPPGAVIDGVVEVRPNVWQLSSEEIPPLLFDAGEAARLLSMSKSAVYELMASGELRSVKVGHRRRVSARALAEFVAALELESA
jgi:excisionase family DNA binding protein